MNDSRPPILLGATRAMRAMRAAGAGGPAPTRAPTRPGAPAALRAPIRLGATRALRAAGAPTDSRDTTQPNR